MSGCLQSWLLWCKTGQLTRSFGLAEMAPDCACAVLLSQMTLKFQPLTLPFDGDDGDDEHYDGDGGGDDDDDYDEGMVAMIMLMMMVLMLMVMLMVIKMPR